MVSQQRATVPPFVAPLTSVFSMTMSTPCRYRNGRAQVDRPAIPLASQPIVDRTKCGVSTFTVRPVGCVGTDSRLARWIIGGLIQQDTDPIGVGGLLHDPVKVVAMLLAIASFGPAIVQVIRAFADVGAGAAARTVFGVSGCAGRTSRIPRIAEPAADVVVIALAVGTWRVIRGVFDIGIRRRAAGVR